MIYYKIFVNCHQLITAEIMYNNVIKYETNTLIETVFCQKEELLCVDIYIK